MRVLLVDDDSSVVKTLEQMLKSEGYIVDSTTIGEDGLEIGKLYDYDIILLDLMMPDLSGYEVLRRLRSARVTTPVLILSGLQETADKIKGFDVGGDDYLTKPYNKTELLARIQAIVRRSKGHSESTIKVGRLSLNLGTRLAYVDGIQLRLTSKEYAILELLVLRQGATLSKETFLNHLYGGLDEPEIKIIDVFVCKLRKKLQEALGSEDEDYIETVWGRGYVLRDPASVPQKKAKIDEKEENILNAQQCDDVSVSTSQKNPDRKLNLA
jgi:two-component system cell cycle response regulator CtrA